MITPSVIACGLGQHQSATLHEVARDQRPFGYGARRLIGFDRLQRGLLTVGGVPQKITSSTGMEYSVAVRLELARS